MDYQYMGEQICKHRRSLGQTQAWLAEKAEVSTSFIGHIERGSRKASIETLAKISLALETSMDQLALSPGSGLTLSGYSDEQLRQARQLLEAALAMIGR